MAAQPNIAMTAAPGAALPGSARLALAALLCIGIAIAARTAGGALPLIGAPIFAIALGVVIANTLRAPLRLGTLRIGEVSKLCLKGGIVLLGASLDLGDIARTGMGSLPLLCVTIGAGLTCSLVAGKMLGIDWRMRCLIGMGTTICGASAIAALAPVIRARSEEIAYSVTVVFFFNMIAVFTFPALGHLMGLSDNGFGIWAGTAVNDTSAVVAAGFAYSTEAGTIATIVKLTRTTMIIPLVIGFGLALPLFERRASGDTTSLGRRVYDAVPVFIILFVAASALNSLGLIGPLAGGIQILGRWVLVVALAAVGLQGHWRAFAGAGTRPLVLGLLIWIVVAGTSLAVQAWTHTL